MWFILDFLVVAIVLLYVVISAKRGFMKTVIELVGFFVSVYLAFAVGGMIAEAAYDSAVEPAIVKSAVSAVGETASGSVKQTVDGVWDSLPELVVKTASNIGITSESVANSVSGQVSNSDSVAKIAESTADAVVKPVVVPLIKSLVGLLLFAVLMILVRFLSRIISKAFNLPLIGGLNRTLGGILGLGKGVIMAFVFCVIISTIVYMTPNGFLIFTKENIEKSVLFGFLARLSPFQL